MNKNFTKASLFSRLMSFTYDSFLVVSFWFLNAFLVLFIFRFFSGNDDYANTPLGILAILATTIFYYVYFWSNGRTTLGMATWNHYLENDSGTPLSIFDSLKSIKKSIRGEIELTDALMVNEVYTVEYTGFWKDIGTPWDLLTANEFSSQYIEENIIGKIERNVEIKGSIHLGKKCRYLILK